MYNCRVCLGTSIWFKTKRNGVTAMNSLRKRLLSLTVVASTFGFGYLGYNYTQNRSFAQAEEKREEVRAGLSHAEDLATAFRNVGHVVEPSVVNIQVRKKGPDIRSLPIDPDDLRKFFPKGPDGEDLIPKNFRNPRGNQGNPGDQDQDDDAFEMPDQIGTGSGVIMEYNDGKGYILTNNHVAGAAEELTITLADGREFHNGK